MIRYGRKNGQPKNTLYTIQDGNYIYFGISRCSKHDQFSKQHGRYIAEGRAELAFEDNADTTDLLLHTSGLRGVVSADHIRELIQYFEHIDECLAKEYARGKERE